VYWVYICPCSTKSCDHCGRNSRDSNSCPVGGKRLQVEVSEANNYAGGKMAEFEQDGFRLMPGKFIHHAAIYG